MQVFTVLIQWIVIYLPHSAIQPQNDWEQVYNGGIYNNNNYLSIYIYDVDTFKFVYLTCGLK